MSENFKPPSALIETPSYNATGTTSSLERLARDIIFNAAAASARGLVHPPLEYSAAAELAQGVLGLIERVTEAETALEELRGMHSCALDELTKAEAKVTSLEQQLATETERCDCLAREIEALRQDAETAGPAGREIEEIAKRHEAMEAGHKLYAESGRAVQAVSPQVHDDRGRLLALLRQSPEPAASLPVEETKR